MAEKPFDWFLALVCIVFGVIMLVAGVVMGQQARAGVLFVIAGPLSFVAFANARKRMRK